jgi:flavin-dependent dehydrogenase
VGKRLAHAERLGPLVGHPIATTHQPTSLVEPGTLVAGEAAKLVDSSSAEGIYYALASGNIAGHFLGKTLSESHEVSQAQLTPYTDLVRQKLGPRLRAGHTFLQVLKTPALDFALAIGSLKTVKKLLTRVFANV